MRCSFIPPYLLQRLATTRPDLAGSCESTLAIDQGLRAGRSLSTQPAVKPLATTSAWTVHTAANGSSLPGAVVRSAGEPASGDIAVDEAAQGLDGVLALFAEIYRRRSYDGNGAPVSATVHYQRDYDNAFWDGTQLVFGDGDGRIFDRFTKPVDVLGHEFTHAVTEHSANLVYQGQSGALNESMSDVFAACLKQRLLGQSAGEADWLIGEGLFLPGVQARGLRDMAAPGTAYDDPVLGKDPQPAHMDDFIDTTDDNGGVHLNSGIPNRAFQLAAVAIGGNAWEGAGQIWYHALTGDRISSGADFAAFATATVDAAVEHADAVRNAWATVGVEPAMVSTRSQSDLLNQRSAAGSQGPSRQGVVEVRRSGGFIGRTTGGSVDLASDDPRADEVRELVERVNLRAAKGGNPYPDMYVYSFIISGSEPVTVPEQNLTAELRRLADLVLSAEG